MQTIDFVLYADLFVDQSSKHANASAEWERNNPHVLLWQSLN